MQKSADEWENAKLKEVLTVDNAAKGLSLKKQKEYLTDYSIQTAQNMFNRWVELDQYLMVKYIDGNIKVEDENGFVDNGNGKNIPASPDQPGYSEKWKRAVAADNGDVLRVVE